MSRMRAGEWVAALGAVGLFVTLFLDWFGGGPGFAATYKANGGGALHLSGWGSLGWFMDVLLCAAIVGGLALTYMTVTRAAPAWPVGAAVLTWVLGTLIVLVLLVRVTIAQPGPDELLDVRAPGYLGLLFAALIPIGGFLSLRDERTDSAEARAYTPPPARPAPGT